MKGMGIGDIGPVALSICVAIVVVAVIALMIATMQPTTYATYSSNTTFDNSTTLTSAHGIVAIRVYNDTTMLYDPLPSTNYTINTATGALNVTDLTARIPTYQNVFWSYKGDSNSTAILSAGNTAITGIVDWIGIIVVIIIAVIILGLVLMIDAGKRKSRG